jgi:YjbE family integral membrane protein
LELSSSLDLIAPILQIVLLDLVLSGDNAVVIAMVSRQFPDALRRRAIVWGTVAAIIFRVLLTFVATLLLRAPLLKLAGALLLIMIGIELMAGEAQGEQGRGWLHRSADNVLRAILIIVGADAAMSLDNVVAVAAAAQDQLGFLVFGLVLSIPILIFASYFLTRVIDAHPWLVDGGAALLGWVAGRLAVSDPAVADALATQSFGLVSLAPVLGAAYVWVQGRQRRGQAMLAPPSRKSLATLDMVKVAPEPALPELSMAAPALIAPRVPVAAVPEPSPPASAPTPAPTPAPGLADPADPANPPEAPAAWEATTAAASADTIPPGQGLPGLPGAKVKSSMDMVILAGLAIPVLGLVATLVYIIGKAISRH